MSKTRQKIVSELGSELIAEFIQRGVAISSPNEAVEMFLKCDPSQNLRFTRWLVMAYLNEYLEAGDLPHARRVLEAYWQAVKSGQIPARMRNLRRFDTIEEIECVVEEYLGEKATKAFNDDDLSAEELARLHSLIITDDSEVTIAVPLTFEAYKWWSRGTQWCDDKDTERLFDETRSRMPTVIVSLKGGIGKLAMYVSHGEIGFFDSRNDPVSQRLIGFNWNKLEGVIAWAARTSTGDELLGLIPRVLCSDELLMECVTANGNALRHIPRDRRTADLCFAAVRNTATAYDYVPDVVRTKDFIRAAVQANGGLIAVLPDTEITAEIIVMAVTSCGDALAYVPRNLRTKELCLLAMASIREGVYDLGRLAIIHVPSATRDAEVCLAAVTRQGYSIVHVPVALRSLELCIAAVRSEKRAFELVPDELKDLVRSALPEIEVGGPRPSSRRREETMHWRTDAARLSSLLSIPRLKISSLTS
ncbi:DUF4116 domain-containing protein [Agrobacterium rubi]|nr:DUF4116 domain-containing protein [Agrobacterium rubi]NTF23698.1 DUF4116 domain-containing protein [Agrobacterium rubi]